MELRPANDLIDRIFSPKMAFYRHVYKNSVRWDGKKSLSGKRVVVYFEQGLGDSIQFARYISHLKQMGCYLILQVNTELHRLFLMMGADEVIDKNNMSLPEHDYHVLSMSLPFLLRFVCTKPYIKIDKTNSIGFSGTKVGIAWEGNPTHTNNLERSCPLKYFKNIPADVLFKLQKFIYLSEFAKDVDFKVYGSDVSDFYDTACYINDLDYVVTVDTSILHLSAAMGKKTFGLLSYNHDHRWDVLKWYRNLHLLTQDAPGDWQSVFNQLNCKLAGKKYIAMNFKPVDKKILITGGLGDFFVLESHFSKQQRKELDTVYLATRAYQPIIALMKVYYPNVKCIPLTTNFNKKFAYYCKGDCDKLKLPSDWDEVVDWSIAIKFKHIQKGLLKLSKSRFLRKKKIDISLPKRFVVIVNNSPNDMRDKSRLITKVEWQKVLSYLEKKNLYGVVLNVGRGFVPKHDKVINMTNKTNLFESVQILIRSKGYIGIDSCLSVLAKQLDLKCMVKSSNKHLYDYKDVYYGNQLSYKFISPTLL